MSVSRDVTIANERGLHARAAARFVKIATGFDAKITVSMGETEVCGSSIMGLMMLAAARGATILLIAEGADAEAALTALVTLVENGFDEG